MEINNPTYTLSFLAKTFAHPVALFVTELVRQKPGECLINEVIDFIKLETTKQHLQKSRVVDEIEALRDWCYYDMKLYYDNIQELYGKPDIITDTSPYMVVYYCEHQELRKHQQKDASQDELMLDVSIKEKAFLAEALLLVQSAIWYCKKLCNYKTLFCLACNKGMLNLLEEYIINSAATYPVLEISDITDLYFVQDYLAVNGFTEMPLSDTHLRAEILGKIIVEADDTVLLYLGFEG